MRTMKTNKYRNLSKLSSMSALQKSKKKLQRDMRRSVQSMQDEYENAMDMFSYKSLIFGILNKVDDVQAMIRYAKYGYDMVSAVRSNRKNRGGC